MTINVKNWDWTSFAPRPSSLAPRPSSLIILFAAVLLFAAVARADQRPQDVWLLSTRCAPRCGPLESAPKNIRYWRLRDDCRFEKASATNFQADGETPTVVYIHGNRTDADKAVTKGMYAYRSIRSAVGCRAFRYVIWSWPARRVCRRNRSDFLLKAEYCDVESYYLAAWLDTLPPETKVSLTGHSFGPRIITGAAHLLAGGEVAGRQLPAETVADWTAGKRNPIRAVLLAAAMDADWLAPDGRHGLALSLLEGVLITQNGCDRALRWYPRLYGRCGPQAMGFVGPCGLDDPSKVRVVDVSCTVGKVHDWRCYCSASNVVSQWARYTFLDDPPAEP